MSPRSAEFMASAWDRLALARTAIESGHAAGAVSAAYYAMLYAARAALSEEDRYAKTHAGTWNLFRETFVGRGGFDPELAAEAQAAQAAREGADYSAAPIQEPQAEEMLELAERFVEAVARTFAD